MSGGIIKAREIPGTGRDGLRVLLKRDLYAARLTATETLRLAEEESQTLLEQSRQQRDSWLDEARREGQEQGLAEWNQILAEARGAQESLLRSSEPEMIRLATRIAEKILGEQLRLDPTAITSVVREVLKKMPRQRALVIEVNPSDVEVVRESISKLQARAREIDVAGNPAIDKGGCRIESEIGVIDARLETQLKCLEASLLRTVTP